MFKYKYLFSDDTLCSFYEASVSKVSTLLGNCKTLLCLPNIRHVAASGVEQRR